MSDFLADLRMQCESAPPADEPVVEPLKPPRLVRIPVWLFAGLMWLDGFAVGAAMVAILVKK
jgi:hypothetical protein